MPSLYVIRCAAVLLFCLTVGFLSIQLTSANSHSKLEKLLIREAEKITKDEFPYSVKTKRGAKIFSHKPANEKLLDSIDNGLTALFEIARKHKYTKRLNYSDYNIFVGQADRKQDSSGSYSPDIAVDPGQYAGSVYDQGGYVYAAGMVFAYTPCAFIIAEHDRDFQRVSDIVRFEGEHLILYHNNRTLFDSTADHSNGGGHPILK